MTGDSHTTKPGPREPLYGPESASTPAVGISGGSDAPREPQTGAQGFRRERDGVTARSQWPAARHLQQAADQLRDLGPDLHPDLRGYADPVADWLDKTANEMAWLAPYREHEGGHRPWRLATRIAHTTLGLPAPDTCPTCHTHTTGKDTA